MRKFIYFILLLIFISVFGLGYYSYKQMIPQSMKHKQETFNNNYTQVESELQKIKQKEQEDKLRKAELLKMQNPEIINTELARVGKLITYEGNMKYSDILTSKSWWYKKELTLDLNYNYGIAIDLNKIKVSKFIEKTVVVQIPKAELKLTYLQLNQDDSKLTSTKTILAEQYSPEDIKAIFDQANNFVRNKINNDKSIFDKSFDNLKVNLRELILKLGYVDVIFEGI